MILLCQGLFTDDCLHSCCVLGGCVVGVELVGDWRMILSIFFDGLLHQSGKRREHVDWGVNLLVVKLPVDKDLSFGDITSQVGNRMSDVIVLNNGKFTGMERMGICVIEPFFPWTLPALS